MSEWINAPASLRLADLRGRVVLIHAFQMLCPACVSHGIPQAKAVHQAFAPEDVTVLGLHTVFEHHAAMGPEALKAFMHEYRIRFPVGVDQAQGGSRIPRTMATYGMQGTPSLIVLDRAGRMRLHHFGNVDDLRLGALLGQLVAEPASDTDTVAVTSTETGKVAVPAHASASATADCSQDGCPL